MKQDSKGTTNPEQDTIHDDWHGREALLGQLAVTLNLIDHTVPEHDVGEGQGRQSIAMTGLYA